MFPNGTFCPSSGTWFIIDSKFEFSLSLFVITDRYSGCVECPKTFAADGIRPTPETFDKYILFFLTDFANEECAKSGRSAYSEAISYIYDDNGVFHVRDSYFMSYHSAAVGSKQFYTALGQAQKVANDVKRMLAKNGHADVVFFPYR